MHCVIQLEENKQGKVEVLINKVLFNGVNYSVPNDWI